MTDEELIEQLVASAPRPTREQVTTLVLLLTGGSGRAERHAGLSPEHDEAPSAATASGAHVDHPPHSREETDRALTA